MAYSLQPIPGPFLEAYPPALQPIPRAAYPPGPSLEGRVLHADTPIRYYLAAMRMMVMVVVMVVW
jgi:hypothetical protein